jgi:hypothetical protein
MDGSAMPGGGSGADFGGYLENIGGPPNNFTNVPVGGVYSPQQMQQGVNAIYAGNDAKAQTQAGNLQQQLRPGFGANSPLLAQLLQGNDARYFGMAGEQARKFGMDAARMNAQQRLASQGMQLNVETRRAGADQNRRQLALTGRGQDFTREIGLLSALLQAGGGAGSLFRPLNTFDDTSTSQSLGRTWED